MLAAAAVVEFLFGTTAAAAALVFKLFAELEADTNAVVVVLSGYMIKLFASLLDCMVAVVGAALGTTTKHIIKSSS